MILPLALAQFIASYAATNMNVAIDAIARDLHTTVTGMQTTITLFTLVMASLMITGSKLTEIWGRKRCFVSGLLVYGAGALIAALAPGLGVMILGYSFLEGIGSALLIPPIYILVTVAFTDLRSRAKNFGIVSGAGGLGAAAGPLIGGVITSALSWRASFLAQVLVVAAIIVLARRITDPGAGPVAGASVGPGAGPGAGETRPAFDVRGAVLCAAGLFLVVLGILQSSAYGWFASRKDFVVGGTVIIAKGGVSPIWLLIALGALVLAWFILHLRAREKEGRQPLLALRLFRNRTANLGLATQCIQWLILQGSFFIVSVFLQKIRGFSAIETGLVLTPATAGILVSSAAAERFAKRHSQRWLIRVGFVVTVAGMALLLALVREKSGVVTFVPGLLLMGLGVGTMLTSSVNVVQSAFPDSDQGDISGLSRSVSNLGSSLGTALAGSIMVAAAVPGGKPYAISMLILLVIALAGLAFAMRLPPADRPALPHPPRGSELPT